ncbi:MAG: hypothetical protein M0R73_09275 [Dehalococcoidia bacterium]|nr:hypothetical protein [Dehalococcoidia bacterium]
MNARTKGFLALAAFIGAVGIIALASVWTTLVGEAEAHVDGSAVPPTASRPADPGLADTGVVMQPVSGTEVAGYAMSARWLDETNALLVEVSADERFAWMKPTPHSRHSPYLGWAVVEINGEHLLDLESPAFSLAGLAEGEYDITIRLMQGDGEPFVVDGVPLEARAVAIATSRE